MLRKIMYFSVVCIVISLLVIITSVVLAKAMVKFRTRPDKKPASLSTKLLPIVVISAGDDKHSITAAAVPQIVLNTYVNSLSNYSFLIPESKLEEINRLLAAQESIPHTEIIGPAHVEILNSLPDGRQYLKVTIQEDKPGAYRPTVGWYIAEDHQVTPKYIWLFWRQAFVDACYIMAFILAALIWSIVIGVGIVNRIRRRKQLNKVFL